MTIDQIETILRAVPLPDQEADPPERCMTWTMRAIHTMQQAGLSVRFDVDQFIFSAFQVADGWLANPSPRHFWEYKEQAENAERTDAAHADMEQLAALLGDVDLEHAPGDEQQGPSSAPKAYELVKIRHERHFTRPDEYVFTDAEGHTRKTIKKDWKTQTLHNQRAFTCERREKIFLTYEQLW